MIQVRTAIVQALILGGLAACASAGQSVAVPSPPLTGGMRDRAGERSFFEFEVSRPLTLHSRQQAPQAPSTRDSVLVQFVVTLPA